VDLPHLAGLLQELGVRDLPPDAGPASALVSDLGWDSLDLAIVLDAFERLGGDVPSEVVEQLRTLGDVSALLDSYRAQGASRA
jgi:acyl carrier protein